MNAPEQAAEQQPEVNKTPAPTRTSQTLSSPMNGMLFQPRSFGELLEFCKMVAASGIVPEIYQGNPGAILVAIQMGAEVGLAPMQALQNIAVINGRPSVWGDAGLAIVKNHPDFVSITEDVREDGTTVTLCRRGQPEVVRAFNFDLAKEAGLLDKKGPWQNYPMRMMQMRARWWAMRDQFPDALRGIHSAEESQDIDRHGTNTRPAVQSSAALDDVVRNAKPALAAPSSVKTTQVAAPAPQAAAPTAKTHVQSLDDVVAAKQKPQAADRSADEPPHPATDPRTGF
jgi:hypothetical protein